MGHPRRLRGEFTFLVVFVLLSPLRQLEEEKSQLHAQRREAEKEKLTIRDELVRLEQDRMELDGARTALHQTLQDTELSRADMDTELQSLRAERLRLQEKVTQVDWTCGRCVSGTRLLCLVQ